MFTDSISDFLTRIRNASRARKLTLNVRSSNLLKAVSQVLMDKKFIENFEEQPSASGKSKNIVITLKTDREPLELKRISKPGQRIYVGYKDIKPVRNGLGIAVISTSHGVMSGGEAFKQKLGGEYICEIY